MITNSLVVLILAALLDYAIADPWGWPHPVRIMGWIIHHYTKITFQLFTAPAALRAGGVLLCLGLISGSALAGWLIAQLAQLAQLLHPVYGPVFGIAVETVLLASCFAGRSLRVAAEEVLAPLAMGDLVTARSCLSRYVGRDTDSLSEPEILRAILETVSENATDGVMAPLFYALVGLAFPAIGSVPFALAYKAASTLDSTVGYRDAPYTQIGWCSARVEDILTWLPCRLTVLTLAVLSGKPDQVWQLCHRDAHADPSPNAGWSECAYAAILGVQMGGTNWYGGKAKPKPLLGDPVYPITPTQIEQALNLTRFSFLFWLAIAAMALQLSYILELT